MSTAPPGKATRAPEQPESRTEAKPDAPKTTGPVRTLAVIKAMFATAPGLSTILAVLAVVGAALPALLTLATGTLIGRLASHPSQVALAPLTMLLVGLGLFFLGSQVINPTATELAERLGRRVARTVEERVLASLYQGVSVQAVEEARVTSLLAEINGGNSATAPRDAVVGVVNMAVIRGGALASGILILAYHWWLGVLVLAVYLYLMSVTAKAYHRDLNSSQGISERLRRILYLRGLVTSGPATKEIRLFGLLDWMVDRHKGEWDAAMGSIRSGRAGYWRFGLRNAAAVLGVQALTLALLVADVHGHRISTGEFVVVATATTIGLAGFFVVTPDVIRIAAGGEVLLRVDALAAAVHELDAPAGLRPVPDEVRHIEMRDVGFRYTADGDWVLRHVDCGIEIGRSTAIVGFNGAGKSTLAKLLCGLYEPTEGQILIDGTDLREFDRTRWQRRFAPVFQEWARWGLPLRENVAFLDPDDPDGTAAPLDQAAETAGLASVLPTLPDGWDTVIGREFGGVDLSGGQWQRVATARALHAARDSSRILLLDEPTSALDVRGEAEFNERILSDAGRDTVLLISHRFSTVRRADTVLVLDSGAIAQAGSHDELMATDGLYAEMFRSQAQYYTDETELGQHSE